jgi:acyl-coenzyme A thioesterase PaaI-like protein
LGDKLKGIGKVDKKGNRIIFTSGKIFNQHDELIAKATGTLNAYPFEKGDIAEKLNKK